MSEFLIPAPQFQSVTQITLVGFHHYGAVDLTNDAPVFLKPEPDNDYDRRAIAAVLIHGFHEDDGPQEQKVAYVSRSDTAKVHRMFATGRPVQATFLRFKTPLSAKWIEADALVGC